MIQLSHEKALRFHLELSLNHYIFVGMLVFSIHLNFLPSLTTRIIATLDQPLLPLFLDLHFAMKYLDFFSTFTLFIYPKPISFLTLFFSSKISLLP